MVPPSLRQVYQREGCSDCSVLIPSGQAIVEKNCQLAKRIGQRQSDPD